MIKLGIVMDPIAEINIKKDTSFAMLLEAQRRGYELHYMEMNDLYLTNGEARATTRLLSVEQNYDGWYSFSGEQDIALADLDVILMRKIRRLTPNTSTPPTFWSARRTKARLSSISRRACATVTKNCSPPGLPT